MLINLQSALLEKDQVIELIRRDRILILAGSLDLFKKFPKGNWIAGTTPYFMTSEGGMKNLEKIFTVDVTDIVKECVVKNYNIGNVEDIPKDYSDNGFSFLIMPAFSLIHKHYAENCYGINGIFNAPLIGWVSGFDLDTKQDTKGTVINGQSLICGSDEIVVMHMSLKDEFVVDAGMINLFQPGNGDIITFPEKGFKIKNCLINNELKSMAKYIHENVFDISLPLVTHFKHKKINVSIKEVNLIEDYVEFYAPVFLGKEYQFASPVGFYDLEFEDEANKLQINNSISCNCVLNYLYANLEGKKTAEFCGPVTFGEIFNVLLNQTLVYVDIKKKTK